jgi:ankyrin repeat protein
MTAFEQLADAIRANEVPTARAVLETNPELKGQLNAPMPGESFGGLAIAAATYKKNGAMLDLLIECGADINAKSDWWAGPFGVLELCDKSFAPELIKRGAHVDAAAAARLGDVARLKEILAADKSQANARFGDGKTPLHYASSVEIAKLLLDNGADVNALDVDHDSTPAMYLVREQPDVARYLLTRGSRGDILLAASLGAEQLAKRILDETPEAVRTRVNNEWFPKRDPRAGGTIYYWTLGGNKSAYMIARESGHDAIARMIAERASPEQMFAELSFFGDVDAARALRKAHPDVASQFTSSELALLSAAAFDNNDQAVALMLELGWPVNAAGDNGATALHSAAWHGNAALVRRLLSAGADTSLREPQFGGTPLDWAKHGAQNSWKRHTGDYQGVMSALEEKTAT